MGWAVGLSMAAKMGMSLATQGLAAEFGAQGVAFNALWPRTVIATDTINCFPAWTRRPVVGRRSWPTPRMQC